MKALRDIIERILIGVVSGITVGIILYFTLPRLTALFTVQELQRLGMVVTATEGEEGDWLSAISFREEI